MEKIDVEVLIALLPVLAYDGAICRGTLISESEAPQLFVARAGVRVCTRPKILDGLLFRSLCVNGLSQGIGYLKTHAWYPFEPRQSVTPVPSSIRWLAYLCHEHHPTRQHPLCALILHDLGLQRCCFASASKFWHRSLVR